MSIGEFIAKYGVIILGVLNLAGLIGLWLGAWFVVPRREFDAHMIRTDGRIKRLEEYHENSPGWEAVNAAKHQITGLDGDLKALKVSVESVNEKTDRIDRVVEIIREHLTGEKS